MSSPSTQTDLEALDHALNQQVLAGDILGAFEKYYASDVVMQENSADPTVGKDANREHEKQFVESIEAFHGAACLSAAVNTQDGISFSEWEFDATFKGRGRVKMNQVAVRRWKDGLVSHERFYYKG